MLKQNIHAKAKCQTITNYPILYQITQYNFSITKWVTISDNERQVSQMKFSLENIYVTDDYWFALSHCYVMKSYTCECYIWK